MFFLNGALYLITNTFAALNNVQSSYQIGLCTYLFDISDPNTMRESSMSEMISCVSSPLSSSSPRLLKFEKLMFWTAQSAITCFNLLSMSFSFTALIQISYKGSYTTQMCKGFHTEVIILFSNCHLRCYLNIFNILQQRCFHDMAE